MRVELLPLLQVQLDLLELPRGRERFQEYLRIMIDGDGRQVLPLAAFNPMSKSHVAELLRRLVAMGAEDAAEDAAQESAARLAGIACLTSVPVYRVALVVADDAQGGWTDRHHFEAKHRFENKYDVRMGLITALLWSSEQPSLEVVRRETAAAVYRTAWTLTHGIPVTLRDVLMQEGMVARFCGESGSDAGEAAERIERELGSAEYPRWIACLYGDNLAESLGYARLGVGAGDGMEFARSRTFLGEADPVGALLTGC